MLAQEIIRKKRDGTPLSADEIASFVDGLTSGSISDAQVAAFAMAVFFQGMTTAETVALTRGMTHSGRVVTWRDMPGPIVDKHSTGGVGDKVSLILAPLLAACGCVVPMVSGRGLGHTGGTTDKLESLAGYQVQPGFDRFEQVLRDVGCAIIGQTTDIAPADKRLYAIRDVTSTIESIPLIVASILSKKLASGLQRLVLDLKFGSGAFASELDMARALARALVDVAHGAGLPTTAVLTDMNAVLGHSAGHAIEVRETIAFLTSDAREPRLHTVVLELAAVLLNGVGLAPSLAEGRSIAQRALDDGRAAERFAAMVAGLGGPSQVLQDSDKLLPLAPVSRPVIPPSGVLHDINVRAVGLAIVGLGGGRRVASDPIDHGVGLDAMRSLGDAVGPDAPLCRIFARTEADADAAERALLASVTVAPEPVRAPAVVLERIDPPG